MKMKTRTNQPVEGDEIENLEVSGNLKAFENIVDKDGHKRFIEGEITLYEGTPSGVTLNYGRWSLSGSHLMLVMAFSIANGTVIGSGNLAQITNIPKWILDKIVPLPNSTTIIPYYDFTALGGVSQKIGIKLDKSSPTELRITNYSFTASSDKEVRAQFDLLIDNE